MRLFLSAGEASGDAYAAEIINGCKATGGGFDYCAIGGALCKTSGVTMVDDSSRWGAIGILESAKVFFRVAAGYRRARRELRTGAPGIFVPIDFGFFNIRLARKAKAAGWQVLYFIPPGSWRSDRQGDDLKEVADVVVTPFSWSEEILTNNGVRAYWFGHPLLQIIDKARSQQTGTERSNFGILPGSRKHEIENNLKCLAQATAHVADPIEFAVATTTTCDTVREAWIRAGGRSDRLTFTQFDTAGVLLRAKAAAVCSGTATLEAALCHCPMVVVYRGSKLMEFEAKLRRAKLKYASLPNILLDRPLLPEFLLWFAEPRAVEPAIIDILTNGKVRDAQLSGFLEIESLLGSRNSIDQTVSLIHSLANG